MLAKRHVYTITAIELTTTTISHYLIASSTTISHYLIASSTTISHYLIVASTTISHYLIASSFKCIREYNGFENNVYLQSDCR